MPSTKRSDKRHEFLCDAITTAVEGGYLSFTIKSYKWTDPELDKGTERTATATLIDEDDFEVHGTYGVTVETIAKAIGMVRRGEAKVGDHIKKEILLADAENDAGHLDAISADVLVQIGTLGEIVYG